MATAFFTHSQRLQNELLGESKFVVLHSLSLGQGHNGAIKPAVHKPAKTNFVFCSLIGHAANMQRFRDGANFFVGNRKFQIPTSKFQLKFLLTQRRRESKDAKQGKAADANEEQLTRLLRTSRLG
jgi:hypothetical protein